MTSEIFVQKYNSFPYNEREILRYAGCMGASESSDMVRIMRECIDEVEANRVCTFSVCFRVLNIRSVSTDNEIDFDCIRMKSSDLAGCIKGCDSAVFMAATIGHGIDRLIRRYNSTDPVKALFLQAVGAERVETMLDAFCAQLVEILGDRCAIKATGVTPRYSPGYGDLALAIQPDFLQVVDASRKIGITINDSLLMAPSKSVTAIAGIKK